jgi:hypothetical protein
MESIFGFGVAADVDCHLFESEDCKRLGEMREVDWRRRDARARRRQYRDINGALIDILNGIRGTGC